MPGFEPVEYQRDYFEGTLSKAKLFPREYGFYQSFLDQYIKGESVLNVGCGPLFYEDLMRFNEWARTSMSHRIATPNVELMSAKS